MIPINRFDHIQIPVPVGKAEEARHFYEKIIGWKVVPRPAVITTPGNWFQIGPYELHTLEEEDFQVSKRHPAFVTQGLAAVRQKLEDAGVRTKDTSQIAGRRRFFFYDPFGNRFELIEYP